MVIYGKRTLRQPATDRRDLIKPQSPLKPEQIEVLYCMAKEADDIEGYINNNQAELQQ